MVIGASPGGLQRRRWVRALCKGDNKLHCRDARKTSKRKRNQSDKNRFHATDHQVVSSSNVKSLNDVRNILSNMMHLTFLLGIIKLRLKWNESGRSP